MNNKVPDILEPSPTSPVTNLMSNFYHSHPISVANSAQLGNSYTDQAVSLLEERIERRLSWDHELLLFSGPEPSSPPPQQPLPSQEHFHVSPTFSFSSKLAILPQTQPPKQSRSPLLLRVPLKQSLQKQFIESQQRQQNSKNQTKTFGCKCSKSKCLKMYCQCFRNGSLCIDCSCVGCKNFEEGEQQRKIVISKMKKKEPTAFLDLFQYKGCSCTKSNCKKGYCDCFVNGLMCGKYCRCIDCLNNKKSKKRRSLKRIKRSKA